MNKSWLRNGIFAVLLANLSAPACAQQADFNEVGRQMAIMLQNSHFARLPFNPELSQRFLQDYLKDLDFQKLYFTQQDVDGFTAKYGAETHTLLLHGKSIPVAVEIYEVFKKRVERRVAAAETMLANESFDFTGNESIAMSRKESPWPVNEKDAARLWNLQIREAVLSETLRKDLVTKLSKEQGKADPGSADRGPKEKVSLRYKRFLKSVRDVDEEEITNYFLSAVARAYDPHTDYMSYREMNRFKDGMKNELVGIGALLQAEEDGATKITGIVLGGPADREKSLKLNDRIVAVDSLNTGKAENMTDVMFMKIDKVVDLIRGAVGTWVSLKVEPAAGPPGETKIVVIQRGKVEMKDEQASGQIIEIQSVGGLPHRVGVITLPSFYADFEEGLIRCSVDVERILRRLTDEKMDGLILDLRNNGGGSLEEVRRMTGFFMESGPVVQVKNTLGQVQVKDSDGGKPIYTGPLVVMTDKSSASASEILAGALQDYNRAVIVGDSSTFGKGTVQQPMDIGRMLPLFAARNRAGFLKVSIQKFYRPSGSSTQMEGVVPQIVIPNLTDALEMGEEFLEHSLPHDRIRPAADFRPLEPQALFIPRLQELSSQRIKESRDFQYVMEDVQRAKKRVEENKLSLNRLAREMDLNESDDIQKQRNSERRERFEKMAESDKKIMIFYKIKLEDLEKGADLKPYDPSLDEGGYMMRAKDETAELDQTPKWPMGLDPLKRESIFITRDLIELAENARLAGILKSSN